MAHTHAGPEQPAPGDLENGHIHRRVAQHHPGGHRSGHVPGHRALAVDIHAIGGRQADVVPGQLLDVGQHPRRGGLPVGAGYSGDRNPAGRTGRKQHVHHRSAHVPRPALARSHVHPEPGRRVHLADGAAYVLIGLGDVAAEEIHPAHVEADRLHRPHRHRDVVRVNQIGEVGGGTAGGEIAGGTEKDLFARRRHALPGVALSAQHYLGLMVEFQPGQHLLVAHAAPRVLVHQLHQLLDGVNPVSHHVPRHPLGHRHQLAVDHQHPVVLARDEALDDDAAAVLPGDVERGAHLLRGGEVHRDASTVIRVVRLHHHRVPDLLRRGHGVVGVLHQALARHRQSQVGQDPVGLFLIGCELDRDVGGAAGDGGLNPLLEPAVPELNQALFVEPDPGDPPLLRGPHQRHGARSQRATLGKPDELVPLGGKIEARRNRTFRL